MSRSLVTILLAVVLAHATFSDAHTWLPNIARLEASPASSPLQQNPITAADGGAQDRFGEAVAVDANTAVIGAPRHRIRPTYTQGAAYVFELEGSNWVEKAKLFTSEVPVSGDQFGAAVAISGDTIVVGAPSHDQRSSEVPFIEVGAAYVFVRRGPKWIQQAKLLARPNMFQPLESFGASVSISGDRLVVGTRFNSSGHTVEGSAFVFVRNGEAWTQQAELTASDRSAQDYFGTSVSISGDTIAVGADRDDTSATVDHGSAYVFRWDGTSWLERTKITAADGASNDRFGNSVVLVGNTLAIGARNDDVGANVDQGSVYLFTGEDASWTQQAKLTASDGAAGRFFGHSIAADTDSLLIGAFHEPSGTTETGAAYVFVRNDSTWIEQRKFVSAVAGNQFGSAVALSGANAFAGAPLEQIGQNTRQGAAYAFRRSSGAGWIQQAMVTPDDGATLRQFGDRIAISGDTAIVGCSIAPVAGVEQAGVAYIFVRRGTVWSQQAKLTASDFGLHDQFGASVAIDGNTVVVGASHDAIGESYVQGSAYVFVRSNDTWTQQAKLVANDGARYDNFGTSVAIDDDTIVVGAPQHDIGAFADQGAAYVFKSGATGWIQRAKLTSGSIRNNRFGVSVAISDKTIAVGATGGSIGSQTTLGSATVFKNSVGNRWDLEARLRGNGIGVRDHFGFAIALQNDTLLVGAPFDSDATLSNHGSAFVFVRTGQTWQQRQRLTAPAMSAFADFGAAVAVDGSYAVIGAQGEEDRGAVFVFIRRGQRWFHDARLTASVRGVGDLFGRRVAISGETIAAGAPLVDVPGNPNQGASYFFVRRPGTTWSP